jgi:hypothetical protein
MLGAATTPLTQRVSTIVNPEHQLENEHKDAAFGVGKSSIDHSAVGTKFISSPGPDA